MLLKNIPTCQMSFSLRSRPAYPISQQGNFVSLRRTGGGSSTGAKRRDGGKTGGHKETMVFTSFDGKPRTVKLLEESVCLIDMDLTRFVCKLNGDNPLPSFLEIGIVRREN